MKLEQLATPIAIILAGALIAGALFFIKGGSSTPSANNGDNTPKKEIPGVQADDHIIGNPDAKVVIVEYSDTECPFCQRHHSTLHKVVDTYGPDEVAWVYRNLPLAQLHSNAPKQAEALECAAELGGNDAFWKYTNIVYERTPGNNGLDMTLLPKFAKEIGLDVTAFNTCLNSGKMKTRVDSDMQEALAATGGRVGTPHNIVLIGGKQVTVSGAQPFEVFKQMIDAELSK